METPAKVSSRAPSGGLNLRVILFILVVVALLGYPLYLFVRAATSKGVIDRGTYKEVELKPLGAWPLDPISGSIDSVPQVYRALDGQKVMIVGQWYPIRETGSKISAFQVVWSISNCCFNGPPQPQERVFAFMPKGQAASLPGGGALIRVFGTLHVKIDRDAEGKISSVYKLDVEKIEEP